MCISMISRHLTNIQPLKLNFPKIRNELTYQKLAALTQFANNIAVPEAYGLYNDENHYAQTLELMLSSTQETRHRGMFITEKILPRLQYKHNLLDIGPGNGRLTGWIGNKFNNVTVIESNYEEIKQLNLQPKILRDKISLKKINASIVDVAIQKNFYDLGLLLHVLYYVPQKKWFSIVEKVYQAVNTNGFLVIALSGDNYGKADLIKNFGGHALNIDALTEKCAASFGPENIEVYALKESVWSHSLIAMQHIAGFFLYDANITASHTELTDYLIQQHQIDTNLFEMTSQQKFILIRKK